MPRSSLFASPFFVGFEELEHLLERVTKTSNDGYPPYNIEQMSDRRFRITVAVAGFTEADLEVTLEDNQLTVRGKQDDDRERDFLHRGIAARQFQRGFVLANGLEVTGAALDNGLLNIDIERPAAEPHARRIVIDTGPAPAPKRLKSVRAGG